MKAIRESWVSIYIYIYILLLVRSLPESHHGELSLSLSLSLSPFIGQVFSPKPSWRAECLCIYISCYWPGLFTKAIMESGVSLYPYVLLLARSFHQSHRGELGVSISIYHVTGQVFSPKPSWRAECLCIHISCYWPGLFTKAIMESGVSLYPYILLLARSFHQSHHRERSVPVSIYPVIGQVFSPKPSWRAECLCIHISCYWPGLFTKAIMESGVSLYPYILLLARSFHQSHHGKRSVSVYIYPVIGQVFSPKPSWRAECLCIHIFCYWPGLFTKAIMESGVSVSPGAVWVPGTKPDPSSQATELASRLGCAAADSTRMLACLRTKDPQSIVQATVG